MSTSRIFHSLHLDISTSEANRICYIILPERLKESEKPWLDRMAETFSANMVVISDLDWDSDLTPWKAPGLKAGEFAEKFYFSLGEQEKDSKDPRSASNIMKAITSVLS